MQNVSSSRKPCQCSKISRMLTSEKQWSFRRMPSSSRINCCCNGTTTLDDEQKFCKILTWPRINNQVQMNGPKMRLLMMEEPRKRTTKTMKEGSIINYNSVILFLFCLIAQSEAFSPIEEGEVMMPNECESCVVSIRDFQNHARRLSKKFGEPGVAEGVFLDLVEDFCTRMMEYRVHREKPGVDRFQKSESALIHKLKDMASKGTNIKADIPMNLWDEPPVEAARLKFDCERILEANEEILEKWFYKTRFDSDLVDAVCHSFDGAPCKKEREDL